MAVRKTLAGLLVALLAAYLYERAPMLYMMYSNAPQRIPRVDNLGSSAGARREIKFADRPGFRSCEDALLVETLGVAIVACDPGRERWNTVMGVDVPEGQGGFGPVPGASLYVYDYKPFSNDDGGEEKEEEVLRDVEIVGFPVEGNGERDLHTLGMAFDEATSTLLVANHARLGGSRIEVFRLDGIDGEAPKAAHVRTIRHPLIHGPNSIALVEGTGAAEFFVTNDHAVPAARNKLLSVLETYVAPPTGTVVYVKVNANVAQGDDEVEASVVARVPFANGIEIWNETTVAVASTSRAALYLYEVSPSFSSLPSTENSETETETGTGTNDKEEEKKKSGSPYKLTYTTRIRLPFLPDNLSLTHYYRKEDGATETKLLIAGHAHAPSLGRFAATRHVCNTPSALSLAGEEARAYCARTEVGTRMAEEEEDMRPPSWVCEWSEGEGLRDLYVGTEYPSSATAARDGGRGVGIVAGLYAKGLLVWRE